MKRVAGTCLVVLLCGTPSLAQAADPATVVLNLDFKAQVQADGSLADIEPDPALTPALQEMLRKQVASWRYRPGVWQGKPVPRPVSQRVVVEVIPASNTGYTLRITEVVAPAFDITQADAAQDKHMPPPMYPLRARRLEIEATLVYAMRRDAQGAPIEVELVGAHVPAAWRKKFDEVGLQAITSWRLPVVEVDGEAIDCRLLAPITFRLSHGNMPPPAAIVDLRPYLSRVADACPLSPALETDPSGRFL